MTVSPQVSAWKICGTAALCAILVRIAFLFVWFDSPFRQYLRIPGLDMTTHLELGRLLAKGEVLCTPYRLLTAMVPNTTFLIAVQLAGGVLTAALTAFAALHLFGGKKIALAAGVIAALYGNGIFYELTSLPESLNVLIALGAFAACLQFHRKTASATWNIAAGIMTALLATGRPTGLFAALAAFLWMGTVLYRKKRLKNMFRVLAGAALVWGPVTFWNIRHYWPLPFYGSNIRYAAAVAEQSRPASWSVVPKKAMPDPGALCRSFAGKIPLVLSIREIPDNINYYFLKKKFGGSGLLVPVSFLVIGGLAGAMLLLFRKNRRGAMLIAWCVLLSVIYTAYYPAGRYRLVLYPYAAVFAGFWLCALSRPGKAAAVTLGLLIAAFELALAPTGGMLRPADHTAWGLALLRTPGHDPEEVSLEFAEAVRLSHGGTRETAQMLDRLLRQGQTAEARKLLKQYPGNDPYRKFYAALLDLGDGCFLSAREKFMEIDPETIPELRVQYWYFRWKTALQLNDQPAAELCRHRLEKLPLPQAKRQQLMGSSASQR